MEGHGRGLQGKWVGRTGQEGRPGPALALSTSGPSPVLAAADLVPERWLCVAWPRVWSAGLLALQARGAGLLGGGRGAVPPDSWSSPPFPRLLLGLSVHPVVLTGQVPRREL